MTQYLGYEWEMKQLSIFRENLSTYAIVLQKISSFTGKNTVNAVWNFVKILNISFLRIATGLTFSRKILLKGRMVLMKLLIVEDDENFRKTVKGFLSFHFPFMGIEEAADGREVLKKVDEGAPDIIFMDIKLPIGNGLVLTKNIKEQHPKVVIGILTGYDLEEYRETTFQYGATYFLPKGSTSPDEIRGVVERTLFGKKSDFDGSNS